MTVTTTPLPALAELLDGLPNLCGWEDTVQRVTQSSDRVFQPRSNIPFDQVHSACAIALHMHQPTIPAGWDGALIGNLQYMLEHPGEGDNHNAEPFAECYRRMAALIPELVHQGANPRVMLDYSGNLLWGLRQMGRGHILDDLKRITCDPAYQPYVEWLGTMWGHAVAPSTPIPDLKLHIQAWQHHFAAIFGWEALARVKGFSIPEMHLPNHPDTLYELVKALTACGYRWMMVQEHTVETLDGHPLGYKHVPHRLIARNAKGDRASITVLIKTQGSDTKLVGQMQPYYEAKSQSEKPVLGGIAVPSLVTQIADGENGGVMMNEFPPAFKQATHDMRHQSRTVAMTGTEYLEWLEVVGVTPDAFPTCQAVGQHQIWQQMEQGAASVEAAIAAIRTTQPHFHMEGASWTNHISWIEGYDNVLNPMNQLSAKFHQVFDARIAADPTLTRTSDYRRALVANLVLQTSCFRYWGQGRWTDYAQQIYDRAIADLGRGISQ